MCAAASCWSAPTPGHYMSPALFLARPEHRVAREEIFGPVACVLRADDYEHALALANDTPFGLCAGICTDIARSAPCISSATRRSA